MRRVGLCLTQRNKLYLCLNMDLVCCIFHMKKNIDECIGFVYTGVLCLTFSLNLYDWKLCEYLLQYSIFTNGSVI